MQKVYPMFHTTITQFLCIYLTGNVPNMSIFAVMKEKKLTLLYTIKKEKTKQIDETGEKANN